MTKQGSLRDFSAVSRARTKIAAVALAACICAAMMASSLPAAVSAAEGPAVPTAADRALAQQLVEGTIDAYTSYTRMAFTNIVSDDFTTDKYAFVGRVERRYYKARPIHIDFFLNSFEQTNDKMAVSFTWNKKAMVVATGLQRKTKGQCMFVYKDQEGKWLLYDIKGRPPF